MTFHLVSERWGAELENALRRDRSKLRIVSPFIKSRALQRLLAHRPERVRVITRFNLDDLAKGVSDIDVPRLSRYMPTMPALDDCRPWLPADESSVPARRMATRLARLVRPVPLHFSGDFRQDYPRQLDLR